MICIRHYLSLHRVIVTKDTQPPCVGMEEDNSAVRSASGKDQIKGATKNEQSTYNGGPYEIAPVCSN